MDRTPIGGTVDHRLPGKGGSGTFKQVQSGSEVDQLSKGIKNHTESVR